MTAMTDAELRELRAMFEDADRDGHGTTVSETYARKLLARLDQAEQAGGPSWRCDACAGEGGKPECMCGGSGRATDAVIWLRERTIKLDEALNFYADPESYFAIGFFPDRPSGEFMEDFSETHLGMKPGKRARQALGQEE